MSRTNIDDIKIALVSSIVAATCKDRFVATGLIYPDGDSINIYVKNKRGGAYLTDLGTTHEKMASSGVHIENAHREAIVYIQNRFSVSVSDGEVVKDITGNLGMDCLAFCEAIIFISSIVYQDRQLKRACPHCKDRGDKHEDGQ